MNIGTGNPNMPLVHVWIAIYKLKLGNLKFTKWVWKNVPTFTFLKWVFRLNFSLKYIFKEKSNTMSNSFFSSNWV